MSQVAVYTTAPVEYDWGWAKMVIDNVAVTDRGKPVRLVVIDDEYHAEHQIARYASGLYAGWSLESFQREVDLGFVKLTPEKEVHYRRIIFETNHFTRHAQPSEVQGLWELIQSIYACPNATLEGDGYRYHLTVQGSKEESERIFNEIIANWDHATSKYRKDTPNEIPQV